MIFIRYLCKRLVFYLLTIGLLLTCIITFIQFFERLLSAQGKSIFTIFSFLALNIPPTFFDSLPIASWLTVCCVVREWELRSEWDSMMLLSITPQHLLKLFFIIGFTLGCLTFFMKETWIAPLYTQAQQFKTEQLKGKLVNNIKNRWIILSEHQYCFIEEYNGYINIGKNMRIITLSYDCSHVESSKVIDSFSINFEKEKIIDSSGLNIYLPSLCSYLQQEKQPPSLLTILYLLQGSSYYLSEQHYQTLLIQGLQRIRYACDIFFYIIATFYLFLFFLHDINKRWVSIFLLYPCMTLISMVNETIACHFIASLIFLPHLICLILFASLYCANNQK